MKLMLSTFLILLLLQINILKGQFQESTILEQGGVKSSAYANANSSRIGETEYFSESPASPADLEMPVLSLNYGDILGFNNFVNLSYSHPTLRGVISGNIKYFSANEQYNGLNNSVNVNLNFSKIFTKKLFVGFGLKFLSAEYFNDTGISIGLNLGAIYSFFKYNENKSTKTLENIRLGFSLLNLGTSIKYNDTVISPPIKIKTGPTFIFNLSENIQNSTSFDFEFRKFKYFIMNIGLENIFYRKYILRLGYSIESDYQDHISAGLGYKFKIKSIDTEADYSIVSLKNGEYLHYLGMEMRFGQKDTTAPDTKIDFNLNNISPNYDGKADYLEITPDIEDNTVLKGWNVQILNDKDELVKTYKSPDMDTLEGKLTIQKVFTRLFEKKKEASVPEKIIWDGINNKGQEVQDGNYKVILTSFDEKNNKSKPIEKSFNLDKTPPEIKVKPEYKIFSPNDDGVKDTIKYDLNIKTDEIDQWTAKIINSENKIVKQYKWKGSKIKQIEWDGKDENNVMVKDGNYTIVVEGKDLAKNEAKDTSYGITLTTAKQSVAVSSSLDELSPNNDKIMDMTEFDPYISDKNGLEKWKLTILNESGKEVKFFKGNLDSITKIVWKGDDNKGNILEDDDYLYKFEAWYNSGNHPESFPKKIRIDNTPPKVEFELTPEIFSPDEDEIDDLAIFEVNVQDRSDIKNWELIITEIDDKGNKNLFKTFKQKGKPGKFINWNGLSDEGHLVQSKNKYKYELNITDQLGNKTAIKDKKIIISTEPPEIDFEFEPKLFSPDDDGENDLLSIKLFSYNNKKIKSWKLNIFPVRSGKRESLFISFNGTSLTNRPIIWDGKNNEGDLVESAMDYIIELTAEDVLGNTSTVSKILNVDILVIKTPYGLKIRISNIEFEYNKAELRGNAFDILDRVIEVLDKYPNYKVQIEGHTDNIGKEEYNLKLSEKRAHSVYEYSMDNGIDGMRLSKKGIGFARPVAPNKNKDGSDNPEGRAKNRRVEFLLIKHGATLKNE